MEVSPNSKIEKEGQLQTDPVVASQCRVVLQPSSSKLFIFCCGDNVNQTQRNYYLNILQEKGKIYEFSSLNEALNKIQQTKLHYYAVILSGKNHRSSHTQLSSIDCIQKFYLPDDNAKPLSDKLATDETFCDPKFEQFIQGIDCDEHIVDKESLPNVNAIKSGKSEEKNLNLNPQIQEGCQHENEEVIVMCSREEIAQGFKKRCETFWWQSDEEIPQEYNPYLELLEKVSQIRYDCSHANLSLLYSNEKTYFAVIFEEEDPMRSSQRPCTNKDVTYVINSKAYKNLTMKEKQNFKPEAKFIEFIKKIEEANKEILKYKDLKRDHPNFGLLPREMKPTNLNNNLLHLTQLTGFINREHAMKDFLDLADDLYGHYQSPEIQKFKKKYTAYNPEKILKWYTRECFFYRLVNTALRLGIYDAILYSRLAIKDLQQAIKSLYDKEPENFSGLLYRGTYFSDSEWNALTKRLGTNNSLRNVASTWQNDVGCDIEMYGFLSTSKNNSVPENFMNDEKDKAVLITILVPKLELKDEYGFVDVMPYSVNTHEEEILFNVRSRFYVLAAFDKDKHPSGEKGRHLYLLYGPHLLRKQKSDNNSKTRIDLNDIKKTDCWLCSKALSKLFAVNLNDKDRAICWECFVTSNLENESSWAIIDKKTALLNSDRDHFIESEMSYIRYPESIKDKLSLNQCHSCKQYKKCTFVCCNCKTEVCKSCLPGAVHNDFLLGNFDRNGSCGMNTTYFLSNNNVFQLWSQESTKEENNIEAMRKQEISKLNQGEIFLQTQDYEKAEKWFNLKLKALEKIKESPESKRDQELERAYYLDKLGTINSKISKYEEACASYAEAWEIYQTLDENDLKRINSMHNLGVGCRLVKDYEFAQVVLFEALEARKSILGDHHHDVAVSYNQIGLVILN